MYFVLHGLFEDENFCYFRTDCEQIIFVTISTCSLCSQCFIIIEQSVFYNDFTVKITKKISYYDRLID